MRRRGEDGSVAPLVIVLFLVAVSFVAVAAAATALHLERLRLLTVADGAALAAAESFHVADATVQGDEVVPALAGGAVADAVDAYLADAAVPDLEGLQVVGAGTPDGRSARVVLTATWRPPILHSLLPVALPVTVESTAAARFR